MANSDVETSRFRDEDRESKILRDSVMKFDQNLDHFAVKMHQEMIKLKHNSQEIKVDVHPSGRGFPRTVTGDINNGFHDSYYWDSSRGSPFEEQMKKGCTYNESCFHGFNGIEDPFHGLYHKYGGSYSLIVRFKKNLPVFDGFWDTEDFMTWIDAIEDYFEELNPPEQVKCKIVSYKMKGLAYYWWKGLLDDRSRHGMEKITSWPRMKNLLLKRFSPAKCSTKGQNQRAEEGMEVVKDLKAVKFTPINCSTKFLIEPDNEKPKGASDLRIRDASEVLRTDLGDGTLKKPTPIAIGKAECECPPSEPQHVGYLVNQNTLESEKSPEDQNYGNCGNSKMLLISPHPKEYNEDHFGLVLRYVSFRTCHYNALVTKAPTVVHSDATILKRTMLQPTCFIITGALLNSKPTLSHQSSVGVEVRPYVIKGASDIVESEFPVPGNYELRNGSMPKLFGKFTGGSYEKPAVSKVDAIQTFYEYVVLAYSVLEFVSFLFDPGGMFHPSGARINSLMNENLVDSVLFDHAHAMQNRCDRSLGVVIQDKSANRGMLCLTRPLNSRISFIIINSEFYGPVLVDLGIACRVISLHLPKMIIYMQVFSHSDENGNVKRDCVAVGKQFAPKEISSQVLRKQVADASKFLGEKVVKAVIIALDYLNNSQRIATKDVGCIDELLLVKRFCVCDEKSLGNEAMFVCNIMFLRELIASKILVAIQRHCKCNFEMSRIQTACRNILFLHLGVNVLACICDSRFNWLRWDLKVAIAFLLFKSDYAIYENGDCDFFVILKYTVVWGSATCLCTWLGSIHGNIGRILSVVRLWLKLTEVGNVKGWDMLVKILIKVEQIPFWFAIRNLWAFNLSVALLLGANAEVGPGLIKNFNANDHMILHHIIGISLWKSIWGALCYFISLFLRRPSYNPEAGAGTILTCGQVIQREDWHVMNNANTKGKFIMVEMSVVIIESYGIVLWESGQSREPLRLFHTMVNGLDPPMDRDGACGAYEFDLPATYQIYETFSVADFTPYHAHDDATPSSEQIEGDFVIFGSDGDDVV